MTDTRTRAVIYARLSDSKKRKGAAEDTSESIDNQVAALTALARGSGYVLGEVYADDGISGYKGVPRERFSAMVAAMKRREFDLILVRHADRLSRNDGDSSLIRTACAMYGVKWQTADGAITDPGASSGSFNAKVLAAVAELESQIKSERLREHYAAKAARGELLPRGGVFGYDDQDRRRVVRREADLIAAAYDAIAEGRATVGSIVRQWNEQRVPQRRGSTRWTYAHLNAILRRHRNAGIIAHRGEVLPGVGQWEAIVTAERFHAVNAILDARRGTGHGFTSRWLSSGIARCGTCGEVMRSNTATDYRRRDESGQPRRTPILRCAAVKGGQVHGCAILLDLEPLVRAEVVRAFLYGPAVMFAEQRNDASGALHEALGGVQSAREDILDLIAARALTRAQAAARLGALNVDEADLRERIERADAGASAARLQDIRAGLWSPGRVDLDHVAEVRRALGERFDALGIDARRALVARLLDIRVSRGRGAGKYRIEHRVVLSLNATEDAVATLSG